MVHVANRLSMLDAKGYVQVHRQMYENYNLQFPSKAIELPEYITNPGNSDTNWQDELFRTGLSQHYMVGLRGGSEQARYAVSFSHADDKEVFIR